MVTTALPKADEARAVLARIYAPISADLAISEQIFATTLDSRFPHVRSVVEHAVALRGKRLRPALLLLSARAIGDVRPAHHVLAAVVEMIHTATLVHDDILDESLRRRHGATVNAEWGNETAVLLGDYLFSQAFYLASTTESTLACSWIGRATNLVCEGEMMQVYNRGNIELDEAQYLSIVRGKTAELTAVSCRLGAHYAGASDRQVEALETYGRELGVAFQIADDVLDLLGEESATGKTLGTDLEKQKLTLPLIWLLRTASDEDARDIRRHLERPTLDARQALKAALQGTEAIEYARRRAEAAARSGLAALDAVPESHVRDVLSHLAHYVIRRPF